MSILELVDAFHESVGSRFFFGRSFGVPGPASDDFRGTVKRSNVVLLVADRFVFDIQPPLTPSLDDVAPYLLIKARYLCIVLFPGSLIAHTLQNIVIIAIVSNYYIVDPDGTIKPYKLHSHMD